jgi:6-phosphofructokinase 1
MKKIAVLCSGGDSSGMNCVIRAVVRTAIHEGLTPWGVMWGYQGLINGELKPLGLSSVGNIIQRGGTILKTSRCPEFMTQEGRAQALKVLKQYKIEGLIVIGGDGSFKGAQTLHHETGFPVVGIPGTIDNDISGTDYTIGFDTALQTAVEAVDRIRDTASSHARTFIVEVMGKNSSAIATHVGVCTGAENIVFPFKGIDYPKIVEDIERGIRRGKNSSIIIVAEADSPGISYDIQKKLSEQFKIQSHVCILGHIQRGGVPTPMDRFMGSQMGALAVRALLDGKFPAVTTSTKGEVVLTDFNQCLGKRNDYGAGHIELAKILSI